MEFRLARREAGIQVTHTAVAHFISPHPSAGFVVRFGRAFGGKKCYIGGSLEGCK